MGLESRKHGMGPLWAGLNPLEVPRQVLLHRTVLCELQRKIALPRRYVDVIPKALIVCVWELEWEHRLIIESCRECYNIIHIHLCGPFHPYISLVTDRIGVSTEMKHKKYTFPGSHGGGLLIYHISVFYATE